MRLPARSSVRPGVRAALLLAASFWASAVAVSIPADAQTTAPAVRTGWQVQVVPAPQEVHTRRGPVRHTLTSLVPLASAPFPYNGLDPRANRPFLELAEDGRRFHRTSRGTLLWEDESFSDPRVLLHIPRGFDARRPAVIVVFFHGHGANLTNDVYLRQGVADQVTDSGINAVLVAPQFAVNAADSSPGKLWQPNALARLIGEAGTRLAALYGDGNAERVFARLPVILVAYSGGYVPAAWSIRHGGIGSRLKGLVLFDAVYGETEVFANWIAANRKAFFISAYTESTRAGNDALQAVLAERGIAASATLDGDLKPGTAIFLSGAGDATHRDFLTRAWADNPLQDALVRLRGFRRS